MPRAVIVDDEPQANALLAALVRLQGYQTEPAFDAAQAQAIVSANPPDVVMLDLMLPDRSGQELCREWSVRAETCASPVVIVSARLVEQNRALGYRSGACDYVAKPFTPDQIFASLNEAARWRRDLLSPPSIVTINLQDDELRIHHNRAQLRCAILCRGAHLSALAIAIDSLVLNLFDACVLKAVRATAHIEKREVRLVLAGIDPELATSVVESTNVRAERHTSPGEQQVELAWHID